MSEQKVYRQKYENTLGVLLKKGSSIHHINFNHSDCKINNLVCLPINTHQRLHVICSKSQSLAKILTKKRKLPSLRSLHEFRELVDVVTEYYFWIEIKKSIQTNGLDYTKIHYERTAELYE